MLSLASALWGFREMTLAQVLAACPAMGITRLEAQAARDVPKHFQLAGYDGCYGPDEILSQARARGISFVSLATGNDFTLPEPALAGEEQWVRAAVLFAKRLRVDVVRIFAGFSPRERVRGEAFDRMIGALTRSAVLAGDHGVRLALENHGGIAATAADMQRILAAVDHPALWLNYDPANFAHAGEDPVAAFTRLRERIAYVHLKDLRTIAGRKEYCACGEGELDWGRLLPLLATQYRGTCAIEYEDAADPVAGTARSRQFLASQTAAACTREPQP